MGFGDWFSDEDGLLGGLNLKSGKRLGRWRPGKRSTEKKLIIQRTQIQKALEKTATQKAAQAQPNYLAPKRGPAILGPRAPLPNYRAPISGKAPIIAGSNILRFLHGFLGDELSGPIVQGVPGTPPGPTPPPDETSDVGYTPNGRVWVTIEPLPFFWTDWYTLRRSLRTGGTGPQSIPNDEPILYPDGTPLVGHMYLPQVDVRSMASFYQNDVMKLAIPWTNPDGDGPWADPNSGNVKIGDWRKRPGYLAMLNQDLNGQPGNPSWVCEEHQWWNYGGAQQIHYIQCDCPVDFDWSVNSPTVQAYPWLYDYVLGKDPLPRHFVGWQSQQADLWRADGLPLDAPGNTYLPGPPWPLACIEFLDNLATGGHGMPSFVDSSGKFKNTAFRDWCAANKPWDRLLQVWDRSSGNFLLATVYDNSEITLTRQPREAGTGKGGLPVSWELDPETNQYYDKATGKCYDPNSKGEVPCTFVPPADSVKDPTTGLLYSVATGKCYDTKGEIPCPASSGGLPPDAQPDGSGYLYSPSTGLYYDPTTGQPIPTPTEPQITGGGAMPAEPAYIPENAPGQMLDDYRTDLPDGYAPYDPYQSPGPRGYTQDYGYAPEALYYEEAPVYYDRPGEALYEGFGPAPDTGDFELSQIVTDEGNAVIRHRRVLEQDVPQNEMFENLDIEEPADF